MKIIKDNNLGKAQLFKGDGAYHLLNLLGRFDIGTAIFLLKITNEINIGTYISRGLFSDISQIYNKCLLSVVGSFEPNIKNIQCKTKSHNAEFKILEKKISEVGFQNLTMKTEPHRRATHVPREKHSQDGTKRHTINVDQFGEKIDLYGRENDQAADEINLDGIIQTPDKFYLESEVFDTEGEQLPRDSLTVENPVSLFKKNTIIGYIPHTSSLRLMTEDQSSSIKKSILKSGN